MKTPQDWPANLTSRQVAAEHATELANRLGSSVNAGLLAQDWLAKWGGWTPYPGTHHHRHHRRKHRRQRGGGQQPQQGQPRQQRPAPRQYLNAKGVPAALGAILSSLLAALWSAAATAGWMSAVTVLGLGYLTGTEQAIADITAAGQKRIGWILETRLKRLEKVLLAALRDGATADELADQVSAILSSLISALLVTGTESQWAQQQAALRAYKKAGVKWARWQTMNDGLVCSRCKANQAQGPVRLGKRFSSGDKAPPAHPRCRCFLLPATKPKRKGRRKRR